jgi:ribonuclease HI
MTGNFWRMANHDWWAKLDAAAKQHEIKWEWVRGHNGHVIQEAVDEAAREIASRGRADEEVLSEAAGKIEQADKS